MKKGYTKAIGFVVACAMIFSAMPAQAQTPTIESLQALIAQLQAQIATLTGGGSAVQAYTFTSDLTIGSTGSDVVALQNFLISKGYLTIPAGTSKGYFGPLTQSALAAFQAANAISPAAGYFGPITRARVNQEVVISNPTPTPNPSPSPSDDELRGGEASLEDFELDSEESSGAEGEDDVEIATIMFDVEDGDARIERVEIDFQAENTSDSTRPWDYFDSISLWVDGDMIEDMDVDRRADWDEDDADNDHDASSADYYRITFTGLDYVVREGDTAEITIAANIAGTIDSSDLTQDFTISIPDNGIRARDGLGIQHYIGDFDETVSFGFDAEETGDLRVRTNKDDPDSFTLISDEDDESDEYTVFVFDIENRDDADVEITDMTIHYATTSGTTAVIDEAFLVVDGDEFDGDISVADQTIEFEDMDLEIDGDDRVEFELVIVLRENAPDTRITFSIDGGNGDIEAVGVDSGDDSDVDGSSTSEQHTIARVGIMVDGSGKSATVDSINGTVATFVIDFTVEALEDDIYIYNGANDGDNDDTPFSGHASTTGISYNLFRGSTLVGATTTDSATLLDGDNVDTDGNYYVVRSGDVGEFTLSVSFNPDYSTAAQWYMQLDAIRFDDEKASGTVDDTVHLLPNDSEFRTNPVTIQGS